MSADNIKAYDIFKFAIGTIIVLGFLAHLAALFFVAIPTGNVEIIYISVGSLGTMTVSIVSYLFGSSLGSKTKDETIAKLQPQNQQNNK